MVYVLCFMFFFPNKNEKKSSSIFLQNVFPCSVRKVKGRRSGVESCLAGIYEEVADNDCGLDVVVFLVTAGRVECVAVARIGYVVFVAWIDYNGVSCAGLWISSNNTFVVR